LAQVTFRDKALPARVRLAMAAVGSAGLDWANLGFQVQPNDGHSEFVWKDGSWSGGRLVREPYMTLHVNSVAVHYGQTVWEGLKAFHCKDGSVRVFNDAENHARLNRGAERMMIPSVPLELFRAAIDMAVGANLSRVPPYGTGGALYLRPLLMGTGPGLGLGPAKEYRLLVIPIPVGNYYASASPELLHEGAPGKVVLDYDRAASRGVGATKCPGNYGADIRPNMEVKDDGYVVGLYLDPLEQRYIEEFNVTNFVGITKDRKYVAATSPSVLVSCTNKCLMQLARDMGLEVEQRRVDFLGEIESFAEVGGVGTAAVVLPIRSLTMRDRTFTFGQHEVLKELKARLEAIQVGDAPDTHGWTRPVGGAPPSRL